MESRYEVEMEHYSKIINIEALTMLEMARKQLLPAVNAYMSEVANTAASKLAVSENISVRSETKALTSLSADADAMSDAVDALQAAVMPPRHSHESRRPLLSTMTFCPRWTPCVPPPTMPRPSAVRITGLCPATARCSTTSDLHIRTANKASAGCRIINMPFSFSYFLHQPKDLLPFKGRPLGVFLKSSFLDTI